jgi:hypothetical protein
MPCPYAEPPYPVVSVSNLNQTAAENGLAIDYCGLAQGITGCVSTPVFLDFSVLTKNFSTIASPTLYSSQTVVARVKAFADENPDLRFYIVYYDAENHVRRIHGNIGRLERGVNVLSWKVPATQGMPIFRLGVELISQKRLDGRIAILDMDWRGAPEEFAQKGTLMTSIWNLNPFWLQTWVSSAKHFAPDFKYTYCISHPDDNGLVTIGTQDWADYGLTSRLSFSLHKSGGLVARSKGHRRYYAAVLSGGNTASIIMRKNSEVKCLASTDFEYEEDRLYQMEFDVKGNQLTLCIDGACILKTTDPDQTYVCGAAGFLIDQGTILADGFVVNNR